ncbi:MAG TPA: PilZ domain-containing protein [Terriglobia bacterium]|nr:PilZ domain-containing protein [Terriglobia bacterium]
MFKIGIGSKRQDTLISRREPGPPQNRSRQGDRVSLVLPIQVAGTNLFGDVFLCDGWTILVSQHGAKIALSQSLSPDQEITVRCLETGKEGVARVVGRINGKQKLNTYGISLLEPERSPWGINFPQRGDSAGAIGRIVMECLACHARDLAYLDGFELEVLESNAVLSRFCKRCRDSSMWKKSFDSVPASPTSTDPAPEENQEKRREVRRNIKVIACVRSREFSEDLVRARNVSRSGLCFESRRPYEKDWEIEVAIPYSSGGGNIYLPARIARVQPLIHDSLNLFGVKYVRDHHD